jgi:hypothetical protein
MSIGERSLARLEQGRGEVASVVVALLATLDDPLRLLVSDIEQRRPTSVTLSKTYSSCRRRKS